MSIFLRHTLILSLALLSCTNIVGQIAVISGTVTSNSTKESLAGVTVSCGTTNGTNTDSKGNYRLEVPVGEQAIQFRLISYKTITKNISVVAGQKLQVDIALEDEYQDLGTVVISASKFEQRIEEVTVSMEVLKPYLIENTNATSADQALDQLPGVNVVDGQANIRGGSGWSYGAGSRVQVMVDDLPLLAADAGDAKWSFIPLENVAQAEVVKGASSVLYGSSALNGIINFRTGYPTDSPETKIELFRGVYDHATQTLNDTLYELNDWMKPWQGYTGLSVLHKEKFGNLDAVVGGNYFSDQGYRREEWEKRIRVNANLRYRFPSIQGLSAGVNTNIMRSEGSNYFLWADCKTGALLPAPGTTTEYTTWRATIDPFVTYVTSNGGSHKLRTRYFLTDNKNNTNQSSKAIVYYGEYQYQHRFNDYFTATGGLLYSVNTVASELYGDHVGKQQAVYAQGDFKMNRWNISGGARAEKYNVDERNESWAPVFRTGVNFRVTDGTFLRGSFGQGYRFPTVAELFVKTNVGNLSIYPDSLLESETGWSAEIGIKQGFRYKGWQGFVDVAVFQNEYKNMMEFTFAQWGNPLTDPLFGFGFSSMNVGDTRIKGIELTLAGEGQLSSKSSLRFIGGYTYLDPRLIAYDSSLTSKVSIENILGSDSSDFLKYRFQHSLKMDVEFNRPKWMIGASVRYNSYMVNVDNIFVSPLFEFAFPGFGVGYYRDHHQHGDAVLDTRAAWKFNEHIRLSFIVKNLLNNVYMQRPADMQPPRTFALQANVDF